MAKQQPLFQLDRPLTGADLKMYQNELSRLQGNVLRGHGREAELHLFLTFKSRRQEKVKRFLHEFARTVTSAALQRVQAQSFRRSRRSELFAAMCLSAKGYRYLGQPTGGFTPEFLQGMQRATARLADPPPNRWEPQFQKDLHAMVLLAHDRVSELGRQLSLLRTRVSGFAEISSEFGIKICDSAGRTIEHFGYVDGRSQPLFFREDLKKDSLNGHYPKRWDPSAGPNLVVVKDPLGSSDADCGSYYVFRKLEQNVKGFRQHVEALADSLHLTGDARQRAGALLIGRFPDGTPLALKKKPAARKTPSNDFAYPHVDKDGNRCPFSAHIRKTNPRGDFNGQLPDRQRVHRIARRGMPYGDPTPPGDDLDALPVCGVGLLFQCCQADLARQFEFLQRAWANNGALARPGTGIDPVIGQSTNGSFSRLRLPTRWDKPERMPFGFHGFVTMKGGEYFFVPSISFLKNLK